MIPRINNISVNILGGTSNAPTGSSPNYRPANDAVSTPDFCAPGFFSLVRNSFPLIFPAPGSPPVPESYHATSRSPSQYAESCIDLSICHYFTYKTPSRKPKASTDNLHGPTTTMYTITNIYGMCDLAVKRVFVTLIFHSSCRLRYYWRRSFWLRCQVCTFNFSSPKYDTMKTNTCYSSMSAWIGVDTYTDYFGSPDSNLQGGVRDLSPPF